MTVPVELSKALDKAYKNLSLAEVLDAPVAASTQLAGAGSAGLAVVA